MTDQDQHPEARAASPASRLTLSAELADALRRGVLLVAPDGAVLGATAAARGLLGDAPAELAAVVLGEAGAEAWSPEGRPVPADELPATVALSTGEPASAVVGIPQGDDEPTWLRVTTAPVDMPAEHRALLVTIDSAATEVAQARALAAQADMVRLAFDDAAIGMALIDLDGRLVRANAALARSLVMTPAELLTRTLDELAHPDERASGCAEISRLLDETAGAPSSVTMGRRFITGAGTLLHTRLTVTVVRDGAGEPLHLWYQLEDITEMRRAQDLLEWRALYDHLTGLANRRLLLDRLAHALQQHRHAPGHVAVVFADLDDFKRVNDSLGHDAGDLLLRVVADRLRSAIRPGDTVARVGGDEFVIVFEQVTSAEHAGELLDAVLTVVHAPVHVGGHDVLPRLSAGLTVNDGSRDAERVLRDADTALYVAKQSGRSRWEVYQDEYRREALHRISVEAELRGAVQRGDFVLHYQPIVELSSGEVIAHEALVRWQHRERGLLLPGEFIQVCEDTDLIVGLGAWVIREAVAFLARHPDLPGRVYVNVSPRQIGRSDEGLGARGLARTVADALAEAGVSGDRLGIEITESGVLQATDLARADLDRLTELGVVLVLDDFGTGYSALSSVLQAPIRGLKLDRSFTIRLGDGGACDRISTAIAALVDSLSSHGVVEGIETEEQRRLALAHGWTHGQGWLFGHPEPEHALGLAEPGHSPLAGATRRALRTRA
ncbi:putative bifunctional diguanylate cyclase/phosphodiesterase [Cellulomonas timonensis]|uniref:putative bifunctional diguanylate cyclase/phosphodiesterase n=1 Tax=Cellulomonas timonensis TaxID=1689271 RepID=UPI00083611F3|nr:bifunctional diguanylate cyclase/phosphodiesterase [Cellulomonas timonensis]